MITPVQGVSKPRLSRHTLRKAHALAIKAVTIIGASVSPAEVAPTFDPPEQTVGAGISIDDKDEAAIVAFLQALNEDFDWPRCR